MPPVNIPPAPLPTYLVTPPPGFAPAEDQIDVDLYLDLSPTAIRHGVRRPPFDSVGGISDADIRGQRPLPQSINAPRHRPAHVPYTNAKRLSHITTRKRPSRRDRIRTNN